MIEIRIHGRGGQGNVLAAYLLAAAGISHGLFAQAFPYFGAERRGAPVTAFVRFNHRPIYRRDQVNHPDFLIIQDAALMHIPGIANGLSNRGGILINVSQAEDIPLQSEQKLVAFAASALAREYTGRALANIALLAAFLSLTELLPLSALETAVGERFYGEVVDRNIQLIRKAATSVPAGVWRNEAQIHSGEAANA